MAFCRDFFRERARRQRSDTPNLVVSNAISPNIISPKTESTSSQKKRPSTEKRSKDKGAKRSRSAEKSHPSPGWDDKGAGEQPIEAPPCEDNKNKESTDCTNNFDVVEEEMQCSICSELFIKAVTLNCCHTFCKYCINQWKKQQSCCPICRKKIASMAPTLVLDNFIEKLISKMDEETKKQRQEIIESRQASETTNSGPSTSKSSAATSSTGSGHTINISSEDDDDDDEDDYSDEDYYDSYYDYNGLPGKYFGGYGRCYNCNRTGHWANGCPYR